LLITTLDETAQQRRIAADRGSNRRSNTSGRSSRAFLQLMRQPRVRFHISFCRFGKARRSSLSLSCARSPRVRRGRHSPDGRSTSVRLSQRDFGPDEWRPVPQPGSLTFVAADKRSKDLRGVCPRFLFDSLAA
jgi:hypothetical protein